MLPQPTKPAARPDKLKTKKLQNLQTDPVPGAKERPPPNNRHSPAEIKLKRTLKQNAYQNRRRKKQHQNDTLRIKIINQKLLPRNRQTLN